MCCTYLIVAYLLVHFWHVPRKPVEGVGYMMLLLMVICAIPHHVKTCGFYGNVNQPCMPND